MAFNIWAKGEGRRAGGCAFFSPLPYLFSLYLLLSSALAHAATTSYAADLNDFINIEIKPWVTSDIVLDNLSKQNEISGSYAESNLQALDSSWRAEYRKINQPLISQVLTCELSQFLQKKVVDSAGVFTEIAIIDGKGLNIAQTVISDEYWNVGKPRWDKTFKAKSFAPYISDVYYSDKTNKFQVEVSFIIASNDQPVGLVSAGIDVEQLEDWKKRRKL